MIKKVLSARFFLYLRQFLELYQWKKNFKRLQSSTRQGPILATKQQKFLIGSTIGGNLNTLALDLILTFALKDRGHTVDFALCDGGFDACMYAELNKFNSLQDFLKDGMDRLCRNCSVTGKQVLGFTDIPLISLSPKAPTAYSSEFDEIAKSGAKRFLGLGTDSLEDEYIAILNKFKSATVQFSNSIQEALVKKKYDVVIAHHGIYVPQALYQKYATESNIKFVSWAQGYRKGTYIFSWNDTYHRELMKPFKELSPLNSDQLSTIKQYLDSRDIGENDWIRFGITTKKNSLDIPIDWSKPSAVLLTNVSWDAQLHYESRLFENMHDWILQTIRWFIANPDCNLIIRIHPAEMTGKIKSREPVVKFINHHFSCLPANIRVIEPLDQVSTYSLMERSNLVIIFGTKAGIEASAMGKPLLIAGEAWSRNKGIGIEPNSATEYFEFLRQFKENHNSLFRDQRRGFEVAYHYFFRKLISIRSIKPLSFYPYARPHLNKDWHENDKGLFSVIKSLEDGTEFEFIN
jgi:hypothetical protein